MARRPGPPIDDLVFAAIAIAASEGRRCPTNLEIAAAVSKAIGGRPRAASSIPSVIQQLVRDGRITVRLYGCNFRDVLIHQGLDAGKATLAPVHGRPPYAVIDEVERKRRDEAPK